MKDVLRKLVRYTAEAKSFCFSSDRKNVVSGGRSAIKNFKIGHCVLDRC